MVGQWWSRRIVALTLLNGMTILSLACGGIADESKLPPDIQDPERLKTPSGAMARYQGTLIVLPAAVDRFLTETGILTDELNDLPAPLGVSGVYNSVDTRSELTVFATTYSQLHRVRGDAQEARGFLQAYAPDSSPALRGHLYAVEAYADVLLADAFCSGIPLSTVDFDGDYTLATGSTRTEVYQRSLALFDSALALAGDSARIQWFAAVGKGRTLLALGRYAEAAAAVAAVPDQYAYQVVFTPGQPDDSRRLLAEFIAPAPGSGEDLSYTDKPGTPSIGDHEGITGLDYQSSQDPRVLVDTVGPDVLGKTLYFPKKYPRTGAATLVLASGIEARLIEAEAAWQANAADGQWLAMLNALRADGSFDTTATTPPDTLWHAGTGGVAGLAPLVDPGIADSQVNLLFRERAFWLYLTGHRQGDLRRLIRQYSRNPDAVYPTGPYQGGQGAYGNQIVAPVPEAERVNNPQYMGCQNFDA